MGKFFGFVWYLLLSWVCAVLMAYGAVQFYRDYLTGISIFQRFVG